jgi:hypothetical protein
MSFICLWNILHISLWFKSIIYYFPFSKVSFTNVRLRNISPFPLCENQLYYVVSFNLSLTPRQASLFGQKYTISCYWQTPNTLHALHNSLSQIFASFNDKVFLNPAVTRGKFT